MIASPAGRCWARAFGIAVGVVATVGAGVVAIAVSEVGWHVALTAVLLMACAAGGVALVVGNLVLARPDPRRARGIDRCVHRLRRQDADAVHEGEGACVAVVPLPSITWPSYAA